MSTAVVSTSAAEGRLFVFEEESGTEMRTTGPPAPTNSPGTRIPQARILPASVTPASRLEIRPAPEMVSSGIAALDALTGGLPRGCITEICGPASSGRTTVLLAALAAATRRGEFCALIDASDALDPHSAAATGVDLDRMLWVRCGEDFPQKDNSSQRLRGSNQENRIEKSYRTHRQDEHRLEQVLRATDLLLESGGFGLIVLDLADLLPQAARRIPLTTWFRFRRAIEHKPTILLAMEQQPIAGSCSSLLLQLGISTPCSVLSTQNLAMGTAIRAPSHLHLFTGLEIKVELAGSRLDRKPARSIAFESKTAWAG